MMGFYPFRISLFSEIDTPNLCKKLVCTSKFETSEMISNTCSCFVVYTQDGSIRQNTVPSSNQLDRKAVQLSENNNAKTQTIYYTVVPNKLGIKTNKGKPIPIRQVPLLEIRVNFHIRLQRQSSWNSDHT